MEKTKAEFECGSLVGPFLSVDEVRAVFGSRIRMLPRFPIWEQHGGSEAPTCRNIDNGLVGEQNNFCGSLYTNRPADLDLFIGLLRHVLTISQKLTCWDSRLTLRVFTVNVLHDLLMLLGGYWSFGLRNIISGFLRGLGLSCLDVHWLQQISVGSLIGVRMYVRGCSSWP